MKSWEYLKTNSHGKETGGQNPVDEAYLRSLMAGGPSDLFHLRPLPLPERVAEIEQPLYPMKNGKADNNVNGTVRDISGADDNRLFGIGYG